MDKVQGRPLRAGKGLACAAGAVLLLAGCNSRGSYYPVEWWRQLEGGRIAEQRPQPPRADDPYPHLGGTPARPSGTDSAGRTRIAGDLVADRANAQYASRLNPLDAARPPAAPGRPPAPPAAGADDSNASLAAASAPPAPPVLAPPVPATPAIPAPAASTAPAAPASPPPAPAARPARAAAPIEELPGIAAAPPLPPSLPGVAGMTRPMPPPPTPPAPPPVVVPAAPGAPLTIPFETGRAVLPDGAIPALRQLASRRGAGAIAVSGFGEASDTDPQSQAAALPLALARGQAIRAALARIGVPDASIRVTTVALGRGGLARVAD